MDSKMLPIVVGLCLLMLFIDDSGSSNTITNLATLSPAEAKSFFDSFDTIISDCDGVLWNREPIPGIKEVVTKLKSMGKKLHFLTNFSGKSTELIKSKFDEVGIDLDQKDFIYPVLVIIDYLKSSNFTKKIFLIGSDPVEALFRAAGFECIQGINDYPDDIDELIKNITKTDDDIGAVVVDLDIKMNYHKVNRAIILLRDPKVLFLATALEKLYKPLIDLTLAGAGFLATAPISEVTGREPMVFGKPSPILKPFIFKQFNITNPQRTIFFGDTLIPDMGIGSVCGFQKMFVLSGTDTLETAENIVDPAHLPDYWITSLGHLKGVIEKSEQTVQTTEAN